MGKNKAIVTVMDEKKTLILSWLSLSIIAFFVLSFLGIEWIWLVPISIGAFGISLLFTIWFYEIPTRFSRKQ